MTRALSIVLVLAALGFSVYLAILLGLIRRRGFGAGRRVDLPWASLSLRVPPWWIVERSGREEIRMRTGNHRGLVTVRPIALHGAATALGMGSDEARDGRIPSDEARDGRIPSDEARDGRIPSDEARRDRVRNGEARDSEARATGASPEETAREAVAQRGDAVITAAVREEPAGGMAEQQSDAAAMKAFRRGVEAAVRDMGLVLDTMEIEVRRTDPAPSSTRDGSSAAQAAAGSPAGPASPGGQAWHAWVASGGRTQADPETRTYYEVHLVAAGGGAAVLVYTNGILHGSVDAFYLERVVRTVLPLEGPSPR